VRALSHTVPLWQVLIAVLGTALLAALIVVTKQNHECRSFCVGKGFVGARFTPQTRGVPRATCHCLTQEESEMVRRVPKGTEVFPWGQ
jgi:hypothetical protein